MEITTQIIDKLANLARLTFTDNEKLSIQQDMQQMVSFINKLQEVDTTGIEPLMHMGFTVNALRDDHVTQQLSNSDALANAPIAQDGFFAVPKVINK